MIRAVVIALRHAFDVTYCVMSLDEESAACDGTLVSERRVGGADQYGMFATLREALEFAVMTYVCLYATML